VLGVRLADFSNCDPQVGPGTLPRGSRECYVQNIVVVMTCVSLPKN